MMNKNILAFVILSSLVVACGSDDSNINTGDTSSDGNNGNTDTGHTETYNFTLAATNVFSGDATGEKQHHSRSGSSNASTVIIKDDEFIEPTNQFMVKDSNDNLIEDAVDCGNKSILIHDSIKLNSQYRISSISHQVSNDSACASPMTNVRTYLIRADGKSWTLPLNLTISYNFKASIILPKSFYNKTENPLIVANDSIYKLILPVDTEDNLTIVELIPTANVYQHTYLGETPLVTYDGKYVAFYRRNMNSYGELVHVDTETLNKSPNIRGVVQPIFISQNSEMSSIWGSTHGSQLYRHTPEGTVDIPLTMIGEGLLSYHIKSAKKQGDDLFVITDTCDIFTVNEALSTIDTSTIKNTVYAKPEAMLQYRNTFYCVGDKDAAIIDIDTGNIETVTFEENRLSNYEYGALKLNYNGVISYPKESLNLLEKVYVTFNLHTHERIESKEKPDDNRTIINIKPNN